MTEEEKEKIPNFEEQREKAHKSAISSKRKVVLRIIKNGKISYITFPTIHVANQYVGCHYDTIRRRIRSLEYPQWNWNDNMTDLNLFKVEILDIADFKTVDKNQFHTERPVMLKVEKNGKTKYIVFSSPKEAAEYLKCPQYQIINSIDSSEFPEWTWTDKLDSFNENKVEILTFNKPNMVKPSDLLKFSQEKK